MIVRNYLHICLTVKCNRHCPYCIMIKFRHFECRIAKESMMAFLEPYRKGDAVEITGGEPTLIPWLEEIVEYLDKKEVYILLRTNGYKLFDSRKYRWLVVCLNTHDEPLEYRQEKRALLKSTDIIMGENCPIDFIDETMNTEEKGFKPNFVPRENTKMTHPFNNVREIFCMGPIYEFLCKSNLDHQIGDLTTGGYYSSFTHEKLIPECYACPHILMPWTWFQRLRLEEEVRKSLIDEDRIDVENIQRHIADARSLAIFDITHKYYIPREKQKFYESDERFWSDLVQWIRKLVRNSDFYDWCKGKKGFLVGTKHFLSGMYAEIFDNVEWIGYVFEEGDEEKGMHLGLPVFGVDYVKDMIELDGDIVIVHGDHFGKNPYALHYHYGIPKENILFFWSGPRQYFDLDIPEWKPKESEFFVDCGASNGDTTLNFRKWCGDAACGGVMFEPYKEFMDDMLKIKGHKLIAKGVSSKPGKANFTYGHFFGGQHITLPNGEKIDEVIELTTIDEELKDIPVTFIKMDIEGEEFNALLGAEETIRKWKPKLAVSVYHNMDDILRIPDLILKMVPEYRFAFRHYTPAHVETIMYAFIPEGG